MSERSHSGCSFSLRSGAGGTPEMATSCAAGGVALHRSPATLEQTFRRSLTSKMADCETAFGDGVKRRHSRESAEANLGRLNLAAPKELHGREEELRQLMEAYESILPAPKAEDSKSPCSPSPRSPSPSSPSPRTSSSSSSNSPSSPSPRSPSPSITSNSSSPSSPRPRSTSPSNPSGPRTSSPSPRTSNPEKRTRMVLISGYSGVGKSALAEQLREPVVSESSSNGGGFFVSGKFDQQMKAEPYSAFKMAFSELADAILDRPGSQDMAKTIRDAVGSSEGRALLQVVPGLGRILGNQLPEETDSGPVEARNRLQFLFRKFTRAVSSTCPLVILLDDLQWADGASLELMETLATDNITTTNNKNNSAASSSSHTNSSSSQLLLVGTFRDNEVGPSHPLLRRLDAVERRGAVLRRIVLPSLNLQAVGRMVSTILGSSSEDHRSLSLARIVERKTNGNPFFVAQFLKSLCEQGMLVYDPVEAEWRWDEEKIRNAFVTENVVDLVVGNVQRLRPETQLVLFVAACLGQSFAVDALTTALEGLLESTEWLAESFPAAAHAVFVDAEDELEACVSERFVDCGRRGTGCGGSGGGGAATYSFVHDHFQRAALALAPEEKLPALQLRLGQALLRDDGGDEGAEEFDKYLFVAMDLCNRGSGALGNAPVPNKVRLARYNLLAAQKAMRTAAFVPCIEYVGSGLALLAGRDSWVEHYKITLDLNCLGASAAYCSGKFDQMQQYLDEVFCKARSFDDKLEAYLTLIHSYSARQDFDEGIATGIAVLKEMGLVSFPKRKISATAVLLDLHRTTRALKDHNKDSLSKLPFLRDEKRIFGKKIMDILVTMCYMSRQDLLPLVIMRLVRWSVRYGVSKYSPSAFASYGFLLAGKLQDLRTAFMFGEVALVTVERLSARDVMARTIMIVYGLVHHWTEEVRLAITPFRYGHHVGMETGDIESALFDVDFLGDVNWFTGQKLEQLSQESACACSLMKEHNQETVLCYSLVRWQCVLNLQGKAKDPVILTGEAMDQDVMRRTAIEKKNLLLPRVIDSYRMVVAYIYGDYELAIQLAERCLDIEDFLLGHFATTKIISFACLSCFAVSRPGMELARRRRRSGVKLLKKMKTWLKRGNKNCVHMVQLAEAELAALRGDDASASKLYNSSIASSARIGYVNDRALAHERAAIFCYRTNNHSTAAYHFGVALKVYKYWGATAKVDQMRNQYGHILDCGVLSLL